MLNITYHACERFAERAMGIKLEAPLTQAQLDGITSKITQALKPTLDRVGTIVNGEHNINGEYKVIVADSTVVTIKTNECERAVKGGATRSGTKAKKKVRQERTNANGKR